jgi:hypothetical protein
MHSHCFRIHDRKSYHDVTTIGITQAWLAAQQGQKSATNCLNHTPTLFDVSTH